MYEDLSLARMRSYTADRDCENTMMHKKAGNVTSNENACIKTQFSKDNLEYDKGTIMLGIYQWISAWNMYSIAKALKLLRLS